MLFLRFALFSMISPVVHGLPSISCTKRRPVYKGVGSFAEQKPKPKRSPASVSDVVSSESQKRPEIAESLQRLASSFEARTFLPQLRDVQRFLERIGSPVRKPKSRAAVMPALIRALARMEPHELKTLASEGAEGESDFSLLARAIMGPSRSNPGAGT